MSTILTPDGETSPFPIKAGILQGETLAPFLFIVVVEYVLRMSADKFNDDKGFQLHPMRNSRNPVTYITDTDFAYEEVLISSSLENAKLY